ncbi:MAG: hypothetical protein M3Y87_29115 [Myxococcota bacterium]|nr:hypothetical protein [Myxococcota bacterium]
MAFLSSSAAGRRGLIVVALAAITLPWTGCAGAAPTSFTREDGTVWRIRRDLPPSEGLDANDPRLTCCAEPPGTPPDALRQCQARGCIYRQRLSCYGTDPGPEAEAEEDRLVRDCQMPCACVCESDEASCGATL